MHNILDDLYIRFPDRQYAKYCIFVHGGPGSNCSVFEKLHDEIDCYQRSEIGWIFYDQRNCGRSRQTKENTTHQQNIDDLLALIHLSEEKYAKQLKGVFGHSYGSKILLELLREKPDLDIKALFAGRANRIPGGASASLLIDGILLRLTNPEGFRDFYQTFKEDVYFEKFHALDIRKKFDDMDKRDDLRKMFYWGNLDACEKITQYKKELNLPDNEEVFEQVVQSVLAEKKFQQKLDFSEIRQDHLLVNGYWDMLMNGAQHLDQRSDQIHVFAGSGHYPHLEEPKRFVTTCEAFF
ncbi:MAG: alpha/beta hydrolase [Bdellovibrionota bacterium]